MNDSDSHFPSHPGRRSAIGRAAALGGAAAAAQALPWQALAQGDELAAYRSAKIDWRQAAGESITVAVIPASYFENLIGLQPQFEALTGIKLRFEKVPPGQIRQKALLDLTSKTATYATHAADPMYYPLYVANKWVEPLDRFLADPKLTDAAWFDFNDISKAWRDSASIDGKPYGVPFDGEVTVQVYRKDLYAQKGLKPATTYDELLANAKALTDPANRMYGLAMRGFAGAGQNMYIYPSILRGFGGGWFQGSNLVVNSAQGVAAIDTAAIWMSKSGFWIYDGYVKPLPSDVGDYVFQNINYAQSSKVYAVHNSQFGEIWWFYPSTASTENDSYVTYNYRENHWSIGTLARTAGSHAGVYTNPLMVSTDGYVYEHEVGFAYDGASVFAESGPIQLGNGDNVMAVREVIPDEQTLGEAVVSFTSRLYPTGTQSSFGPYSAANPTSVRFSGRQVNVKVTGAVLADWRVGTMRLDAIPMGKR